jgi:hypothetical protein
MIHLWPAVTTHGSGHLAQAAPGVRGLAGRHPLRLAARVDLTESPIAAG